MTKGCLYANRFTIKMKIIFIFVLLAMFLQPSLAHSVSDEGQTAGYISNEVIEKIQIQTSQIIYSKGENIWIRCNLIDGVSNIPSTSAAFPKDRSKFIYVELYDCQADTLIHRYKIKADSLGVFSNVIEIPNNIEEGYYMLVAYTQRMMNFSERDFAYKEIYVAGSGNTQFTSHSSDKELSINVYPEGGGLLPKHLQNITYTITDSQHYPREAEVRLINVESDSIITQSHTEFNGLGQIYFVPEESMHYYLEAYTTNGAYGRKSIREVKAEGALLQIKRRKNLISIDIITHNQNTDNLQLSAYNNGLIVPINVSGNNVVLSSNSFQKGKVTFILSSKTDNTILSTRTIYVSKQ